MQFELLNGDCLQILPTLPADSIDLTVTSPPYDNLRTYNDSLTDWNDAKWQAIIAELYRVTKPGGVVVWVVADATINGSETGTSFRQALHALECGFRLHDTMIYRTNKPPMNDRRYQSCFEYMFVWSKGRLNAFNALREPSKHAGKGRRTNTYYNADGSMKPTSYAGPVAAEKVRESIWYYAGAFCDGKIPHPARFPEALARDHILSWSNEGNTVLDPFLGSGTTGKMAVQLGRKFIGIERDLSYFEMARQRISAASVSSV